MIAVYAGLPGAGKSYDAMVKVMELLLLGRKVFTNIDGLDNEVYLLAICLYIKKDMQFLKEHLVFVSNADIAFFPQIAEQNAVFVIDEAHKYFSNREWQTEKNIACCHFCSTHRHQGIDIIFITQDIAKIDSQIRSLVEWTYYYKKVNVFGSLVTKRYQCFIYAGGEHDGSPHGSYSKTYNVKVFDCYKSFDDSALKDKGINRSFNIFTSHPIFWCIPFAVALMVYMIFFKSSIGTGDPFGTKKIQARHEQQNKEIFDKAKEKQEDQKVTQNDTASIYKFKKPSFDVGKQESQSNQSKSLPSVLYVFRSLSPARKVIYSNIPQVPDNYYHEKTIKIF